MDISERELTRDELDRLIDAGLINPAQRQAALSSHRKSIDWSPWMAHWSTALGAVFLLAGVIFFFAWNWKELSPFTRFAVLEGGVVLATVGALFVARRLVVRQWFLTAAAVLTGVLVAVFGQVYQTGADAFEVFVLWAVLIIGWVVISRYAPLWLLWLAVLQTAVATYMSQVLGPAGKTDSTTMFLVLGLILAGAVILREFLAEKERFSWLRGEWIRVFLVALALYWLSMIPWEMIFEFRWWNSVTPALRGVGLVVWAGAAIGGGFYFTRVRPSLTSVGLCVLAGAVMLVMWLGRVIIENNEDGAGSWLLAGILAILIFSGAAVLIIKASKFIAGETNSAGEEEGES